MEDFKHFYLIIFLILAFYRLSSLELWIKTFFSYNGLYSKCLGLIITRGYVDGD